MFGYVHKKLGEVEPDKALKLLPTFYAGTIGVGIAIAIILSITIKTENDDLRNVVTLVLEVMIGIIITWTVFVYSKKWKVENDKMTSDVRQITKDLEKLTQEVNQTVQEESKIRKEIRNDVSFVLRRKLNSVIHSLQQAKKMYANFVKETNSDQAKIWKNNMTNDYDRCYQQLNMQLNLIDLMKIFGTTPARKYWNLLMKIDIRSEMYGENELSVLNEDVEGFLADCLEIKEIIKPWADQIKKEN